MFIPTQLYLSVVVVAAESMSLATLGTLLGGAGVVLGAFATIVMRKDSNKTTDLQLAWDIQKQNFAQQQLTSDNQAKLLSQANDTINDLRVQQRQADDRATLQDQKYAELERRHHDCEQGRLTLTADFKDLQREMEDLKRGR